MFIFEEEGRKNYPMRSEGIIRHKKCGVILFLDSMEDIEKPVCIQLESFCPNLNLRTIR